MSTETSPAKRSSIDTLLAPRGSSTARGGDNSSERHSRGGGEGMDRRIEKKTWTPKRIAMIIAGVAFLALIAWGISSTSGGRKLNVDLERLTISDVTFIPFQEMIPGTGNVEPRTTVFLDAVEGGRIEEIFVLEGETVSKDQPILRLSNPTLQLQLLQTETQRIEQRNRLEDTRFQVDQANLRTQQDITNMDYNIRRLQREYERNEALHQRQLISDAEFERIKDEYDYWQRRRDLTIRSYRQDSLRQRIQIDQMEAAVQRMDQNFEIINERLENLTLKAPVDGQLSQLNAELGELKNAGFRFGQIDVLDGVKVRAGIDEFHITRVKRGQRAITNPIGGQEYEMVVRRVYPQVLNSRFEIDLDFVGEAPASIRRGQTVRFRLEMSDPADAVVVPQGGFFQTTGGNWIYVVDASGEYAEKRAIRLGRKNLDVYEVLEGLQPGERVVTSSYDTFNEADRLVFR
jgi:HlyD family secretion protein